MSTQEKIIHIIPATKEQSTPAKRTRKKRVAAYARVSTGSDEQLTSFKSQVSYYTHFIKSHPGWTFVGVYSDEGLSGLTTKRREGFNKMLKDARSGKIDLILTKSISRFARNTLDTLTIIRELKAKGIEIYFEKENIYTLDSKGELLITIMSSLAQEESRSISENITWGIRRKMARGKVTLPYARFLGYTKGPDGSPQIVEEEAQVVRRIFNSFIAGASLRYIARQLETDHILTPSKQNCHWTVSTIASILKNEKYKGDALLQKVYTVDYLSKTLKPNTGERPRYYVEHSHPAIISAETYEKAQNELKLRAGTCGHRYISPFFNLIICDTCGGHYRRITRYVYKGQTYISWACEHRDKCSSPAIHEEALLYSICSRLPEVPLTRPALTAAIEYILVKKSGQILIIPK